MRSASVSFVNRLWKELSLATPFIVLWTWTRELQGEALVWMVLGCCQHCIALSDLLNAGGAKHCESVAPRIEVATACAKRSKYRPF